jgi:hypothetical protein
MLDAVHRSLKQNPMALEQIWMGYAQFWQQLGWSAPQVKLWLACQPNIHVSTHVNGEQTYRIDAVTNKDEISLADELVALLAKAGRPMPLAQLLGKLPAGWVVTEPMLRTVAQQDPRLELKGPLIKLA